MINEQMRENLHKVIALMEQYPDSLDMHLWGMYDPHRLPLTNPGTPMCGTVACIAGHYLMVNGYAPAELSRMADVFGRTLELFLLNSDLSEKEVCELLWVSNWPDHYADAYERAATSALRVRVVKDRILKWIDDYGGQLA